MSKPGQQSIAGLRRIHKAAQHIDQHHFGQPVERGLTATFQRRCLRKQQGKGATEHIFRRQRQYQYRRQTLLQRVARPAKIDFGAHEFRPVIVAGDQPMRTCPGKQDGRGRLKRDAVHRVAVHRHASGAQDMHVPRPTGLPERFDAANRPGVEHACGDADAVEHGGQSVRRRGFG